MPGITLDAEIKILTEKFNSLNNELIRINWLNETNERKNELERKIQKLKIRIDTLVVQQIRNGPRTST